MARGVIQLLTECQLETGSIASAVHAELSGTIYSRLHCARVMGAVAVFTRVGSCRCYLHSEGTVSVSWLWHGSICTRSWRGACMHDRLTASGESSLIRGPHALSPCALRRRHTPPGGTRGRPHKPGSTQGTQQSPTSRRAPPRLLHRRRAPLCVCVKNDTSIGRLRRSSGAL